MGKFGRLTHEVLQNDKMQFGESILSPNRLFRLVFQEDSNLVVYEFNKESGKESPVWASNSGGKNANHLTLQQDGNLVVYDSNNHPVWTPNTYGKGVARGVM